MDLCAQTINLTPNRELTHISLAIADSLGDYRDEPQPMVAIVAAADPLEVPRDCCPKCLAARKVADCCCPCCGLAYARFRAGLVAPSKTLLESFVTLHAEAAAVEEHSRLLTRAELLGELPQVVRLYRIWATRDPGNLVARKILEEAVKRATAPLAVATSPRSNRRLRNLILLAGVATFLLSVTIKTASALL